MSGPLPAVCWPWWGPSSHANWEPVQCHLAADWRTSQSLANIARHGTIEAHATNDFHSNSNSNSKDLKFLLQNFLTIRLLQIFAYVTTAVLSWHEQNFVVITLTCIELQQNKYYDSIWNVSGPTCQFQFPAQEAKSHDFLLSQIKLHLLYCINQLTGGSDAYKHQ